MYNVREENGDLIFTSSGKEVLRCNEQGEMQLGGIAEVTRALRALTRRTNHASR